MQSRGSPAFQSRVLKAAGVLKGGSDVICGSAPAAQWAARQPGPCGLPRPGERGRCPRSPAHIRGGTRPPPPQSSEPPRRLRQQPALMSSTKSGSCGKAAPGTLGSQAVFSSSFKLTYFKVFHLKLLRKPGRRKRGKNSKIFFF